MSQMVNLSPLKKQRTLSSPAKLKLLSRKSSLFIQGKENDQIQNDNEYINDDYFTPNKNAIHYANSQNNVIVKVNKHPNESESMQIIRSRIDFFGTPIVKSKKKKKYKAVFRDDIKKGPLEDIVPIMKNIMIDNMTLFPKEEEAEKEDVVIYKPSHKNENCSCMCTIF